VIKIRLISARKATKLERETYEENAKIETLRIPPSNHLEELKGERKGQHSIRINKQWKICFTWKGSDVYDVEIADYH
jgi:plasmid maintenance system killer protein